MAEAPLPARLALQTGSLDDHRAYITADDACWESASARYLERRRGHSGGLDGRARSELEALCRAWPRSNRPARGEALAVTVELAGPFAGIDRILRALATPSAPVDTLAQELANAPLLASPWAPPRPRFPYVYDPDRERRAPIVAILDGPRSRDVAKLMNTIKQHDENLATAIVLGAELEMLDMLDRISLDARRASRAALAERAEGDKNEWLRRADAARSRQRLEGGYYGWLSDNLPPGCLEAARGEIANHAGSS